MNLAKRNLELLNKKGINDRIRELKVLVENFDKNSHKEAVASAEKLAAMIKNLEVQVFQSDITLKSNSNFYADIIITDFPYGKLTHWNSCDSSAFFNFIES